MVVCGGVGGAVQDLLRDGLHLPDVQDLCGERQGHEAGAVWPPHLPRLSPQLDRQWPHRLPLLSGGDLRHRVRHTIGYTQ